MEYDYSAKADYYCVISSRNIYNLSPPRYIYIIIKFSKI